jgi:hypothetical protein
LNSLYDYSKAGFPFLSFLSTNGIIVVVDEKDFEVKIEMLMMEDQGKFSANIKK